MPVFGGLCDHRPTELLFSSVISPVRLLQYDPAQLFAQGSCHRGAFCDRGPPPAARAFCIAGVAGAILIGAVGCVWAGGEAEVPLCPVIWRDRSGNRPYVPRRRCTQGVLAGALVLRGSIAHGSCIQRVEAHHGTRERGGWHILTGPFQAPPPRGQLAPALLR